jgi:hypothetical protein
MAEALLLYFSPYLHLDYLLFYFPISVRCFAQLPMGISDLEPRSSTGRPSRLALNEP